MPAASILTFSRPLHITSKMHQAWSSYCVKSGFVMHIITLLLIFPRFWSWSCLWSMTLPSKWKRCFLCPQCMLGAHPGLSLFSSLLIMCGAAAGGRKHELVGSCHWCGKAGLKLAASACPAGAAVGIQGRQPKDGGYLSPFFWSSLLLSSLSLPFR